MSLSGVVRRIVPSQAGRVRRRSRLRAPCSCWLECGCRMHVGHSTRARSLVEPATYLIVNADDFGYTRGVNRGIVEAHEHGIVTSASLMVKQRAAEEAAAYARSHTQLSLGLHIELRRWRLGRLRLRRSTGAYARLREAVAI